MDALPRADGSRREPPRSLSARWALALLALAAASSALAEYRWEAGEARALDSDRPLYREHHLLRVVAGRPRERLVVYRCNDGTPFARKAVDYGDSGRAPSFELTDVRSGYREGVERREGAARVFVVRPGEPERSAPLPAGPVVADAGFDTFVREAWPSLTRGEAVDLDFVVPSRLDSYGFSVRELAEDGRDGERTFRLRLGGFWGWFAPHIDVAYAEADRRLLRFEGLSNLRDDRGEAPLKVRVEFPQPPRAASPEDWRRLAAEPLRACAVTG